jgi:ornithine cyclodeaminase/alanine dehydrogenase-like protein (mu-crystallin family)
MAARPSGTLLLTRSDVERTLEMPRCLEAVEQAFRMHGSGSALPPAVASVHVPQGAFHVKAGVLTLGARSLFVAKTNGNFPGNPQRHGLPTVQGTLVVCDAERGSPIALLDSIAITALRTAAATAVAARHLARADASTLAIIGCGLQGAMHVEALSLVRQLRRVVLFDVIPDAARHLALRVETLLKLPVAIASSVAEAAREADICVTCTTSTEFLLEPGHVTPGALVAGVGVDSERKRELAPSLLACSKVVVDVLSQCAAFGDLHHAIDAGAVSAADVHAELGQVVAGTRPGREAEDEVIVFDSTGMALQDVAAAAIVIERAVQLGLGSSIDLTA